MAESKLINSKSKTIGDSAVDGLFAGVMAGLVMTIYLVAAGLLDGEGPAVILSRFTPRGDGSPLLGAAAHLAVSAIYGAIFALLVSQLGRLRPALLRFSWLFGVVYGLGLWLAAELIILPAVDSPLQQIPAAHFAIAHIIFGLILGIALARFNRSQ